MMRIDLAYPLTYRGRRINIAHWLDREHAALAARLASQAAFAVLVFCAPFRLRTTLAANPNPPIFSDYTDWQFFASDAFLAATLALWLISLALKPRRIVWGPRHLTVPVAAVVGIAIASTATSVSPSLSLYNDVRLVGLFALYGYLVNELSSIRFLYVPVAAQVFVQAAVGIAQVMQQRSIGLQSVGELLLNPAWQGISTVWSGTTISLRAYGLTDHPNILGGSLAFGLVVLAAWYVDTRWRSLVIALFGLGALALFLTFSRAAWLALGCGLLAAAICLFAKHQAGVVASWIGLLAAAGIFAAPFLWQDAGFLGARLNPAEPSMFTGQNRALAERDALNRAALQIAAERPFTGSGIGTSPLAMRADAPLFPFDYQPAHLALLDATTETGVIGGLAYLAAMLAPWLALWKYRHRIAFTPAFAGAAGLLLAVTVVGLFDYYTWLLEPGRLWQFLIWGLWGASWRAAVS
ncbi:MAG: O-antigen ligase family protein [Chloroflexi bacterium]|nr:O-antigen ligase family protein [Chloroflexota bacterium]